jgi:hypothetical protein
LRYKLFNTSTNLNLNSERATPATNRLWRNKVKIESEIPILNGFHVEPNFLEGVLSGVSNDDEIGVPFNRICYGLTSFSCILIGDR